MIDNLHRAQRGTAILVTTLVQTIGEFDPAFQKRFLARLEAASREVRDSETYNGGVNELELIAWTREYLTGKSLTKGQEQPFNSDYKPR